MFRLRQREKPNINVSTYLSSRRNMTLESGLKSLRHVAMVAKFVDDNEQKTSLKK